MLRLKSMSIKRSIAFSDFAIYWGLNKMGDIIHTTFKMHGHQSKPYHFDSNFVLKGPIENNSALIQVMALQWRHDDHDGVSNHQPHDCLLNRLLRRRSKKTPKLRVTGLCAGNSPGTGEFPAQMASDAENVSIWWRHHGLFGDKPTPELIITHTETKMSSFGSYQKWDSDSICFIHKGTIWHVSAAT